MHGRMCAAIMGRYSRKDVHQLLAGLANVIQEIKMDLSPQRFDVKSVQEGSIWSGLENILHDMHGSGSNYVRFRRRFAAPNGSAKQLCFVHQSTECT